MSHAPSMSTHDADDQDLDLASPSASSLAVASKRRKAVPVHRCRFPDWSPSAIAALTITPPSFDTALLNFGGESAERGVLGVARANGDVELMCWGGHQGWLSWRTLPSSFPVAPTRSSKKPTSQLSHLLFTHQTTLSPSDLLLYDGDVPGAQAEVHRWEREGVRLFGVGGVGSELVEWEWGGPGSSKEVGRVKSTLPTLPPIFALAASRSSSHLAIGCEDSTIRILNILDDELELVSKIEVGGPGRVRALSLAWGPPAPPVSKGKAREGSPSEASSLPAHFATPTESYLVAGCSNSSIRRFDAPATGSVSGHWRSVHRMTVDQLKGEQTVVWAVAVLADGTVVSADSMGNVKFWDGEMGTQTQSFRAHKADVLCLTVGSTGTSLFSSGVDQKTAEFRLVTVSSTRTKSGPSSRWIQASGRRLHSHDVRSLVVSPPYSFPLPNPPPTTTPTTPLVPLLTSGGLDLSLVVVPISPPLAPSSRPSPSTLALRNPVSDAPSIEFETTVHRRASYVPQRARPFEVARDARLLVCRRARSVGVWRLEDPKGSSAREEVGKSGWRRRKEMFGVVEEEHEEEDVPPAKGWAKVIDMELKLQTNLVASAVSSDGKWLAVSDLYETKLFRLSSKDGELSPRRQKTFSTSLSAALPLSLGTGSSALLFTSDSSRLVLATSFGSSVAIIDLPTGRDEVFEVVRVFGEHAERTEGTRETRGVASRTNGDVKMNGVNGNGNGAHHGSDDEEDEDVDMDVGGATDGVRGDKPATVVCLAVSSDGKWLASVDVERKVCVFDLEQLKHYTTLPTPPLVPSALTFLPPSPLSEPTLVLVLPTNALSLFSLTSLRFLPWALPLSSLHSNTLMDMREPALGLSFEPRPVETTPSLGVASKAKIHESRLASLWSDQILVVWAANWVAKIDLDDVRNGVSTPAVKGKAPVRREADRKRAREEEGAKGEELVKVDIRTTRRYQPLVLFDFVGQAELVAVERVWWDIAKDLPEAWAQSSQFGT